MKHSSDNLVIAEAQGRVSYIPLSKLSFENGLTDDGSLGIVWSNSAPAECYPHNGDSKFGSYSLYTPAEAYEAIGINTSIDPLGLTTTGWVNDWTVAWWHRQVTKPTGAPRYLFLQRLNITKKGLVIDQKSDGGIGLYVYHDGGGLYQPDQEIEPIAAGADWHFISYSYDSTSKVIFKHINGVHDYSMDTTGLTFYSSLPNETKLYGGGWFTVTFRDDFTILPVALWPSTDSYAVPTKPL